jgi:hypothetical protein
MVRYEVSGFREQGTVAGRSEMMPNFRILHLYEKRCNVFYYTAITANPEEPEFLWQETPL